MVTILSVKNMSHKKGFGILEVLISAVIIITILSALVFIGRAALSNNVYIQQKTQAVYLAQEAIEQVRQIRDTNWVDADPSTQYNFLAWNLTKTALTTATNGTSYKLEYIANRWGLSPSAGETISIDSGVFSRTIKINPVGSLLKNDLANGVNDVQEDLQSLKVDVVVTWNFNGQIKTVSASEVLTNWRPNF